MDPVIDLCEIASDIPAKLPAFIIFEALELLDQVQFELNGDPRGELERDILVGEGAAVPARFCDEAPGMGLFDPLFGRERERVESGLFSKPVEFHGFKIRVVELFPDTEKLNGVAIPDPVPDQIVRAVRVLVPGNIRDADIILIVLHEHSDFPVKDIDGCHCFLPASHQIFFCGCLLVALSYVLIEKRVGTGGETVREPGMIDYTSEVAWKSDYKFIAKDYEILMGVYI